MVLSMNISFYGDVNHSFLKLMWTCRSFNIPTIVARMYWMSIAAFFGVLFGALLQSSCYSLYAFFKFFSWLLFVQMPSFPCFEKVISENCGTQTTKFNLPPYYKSCSNGTLHGIRCSHSSTNSQRFWIIILVRSRALQNLILLSGVKIDTENFQTFRPELHDNKKILNMVFISRHRLLILTISTLKLMIRILRKIVAFMSKFPRRFWTRKKTRHSLSNYALINLNASKMDKRHDFFSTIESVHPIWT